MNVEFLALLKSAWIPAWGTFALVLIWYFRTRAPIKASENDARKIELDAQAAVDAAQYHRLQEWIEKLETRIVVLEDEVSKCHAERDAALAENARLNAINLGRGQLRQEASRALAGERLAEAAEKKRKRRE